MRWNEFNTCNRRRYHHRNHRQYRNHLHIHHQLVMLLPPCFLIWLIWNGKHECRLHTREYSIMWQDKKRTRKENVLTNIKYPIPTQGHRSRTIITRQYLQCNHWWCNIDDENGASLPLIFLSVGARKRTKWNDVFSMNIYLVLSKIVQKKCRVICHCNHIGLHSIFIFRCSMIIYKHQEII